ncbi:MAG: DUF4760 domain-containing protein [Promethearchaeota archaeon]
MQQFDVASFSIVLASISVIIGVILAILQLREQNKTRQAQLFIEIYAQFMRGELQDMHYEILEAFGRHTQDSHPESWEKNRGMINPVLSFLEGVGVLVKKGLLDINLVADLISTPTINTWEAIQKWVMWYRDDLNRPQLWEWTEYLYHEIMKIPSRVSPSRSASQK